MSEFESNWKNAMGGHLDYHEALNDKASTDQAGGGGEDENYKAPKNYKPSTVDQRKRWNSFLDYLSEKGIAGKADLDARDRSLGKKYLDEYNKANPDNAVPAEFIPVAQYESYLIRKKHEFPGMTPDQAGYAFNNLAPKFQNMNISAVDSWLGSATSQQYYPQYRRETTRPAGNKDIEQFGTSFEDYVKGIDFTKTAPSSK